MGVIGLASGFLLLGALLGGGGWMLLGEYQKVFRADPRVAMSVEVLLQILFNPAATAVFLGALSMFFGFWFLAIGILILAFPLVIGAATIINAAATSLGLGRILPF